MYIDYWYALVLKILAVIGAITLIAAVVNYFEGPLKNCRHGNEMTFPMDGECIVEFNVEGKNLGWTIKPYHENAKKLK